MIVNQIYSLINSVSAQVWGTAAPTVQDLSGIISLGKMVGANGVWTADSDKYLGALVDRIGKTVLRTLDTRVDFPNLIKESFEFGAVLQKIDVQPIAATNDNSWNVGADDFTSNYLSVYKPTIDSTLFSGINTWTVKTTIPDKLFTSAFDSESGMTSFVNAIIDSLTNSLEAQFNKVSHLAVCNFIAEKKKNSNGIINLVTMYNAAMGYTSESAGYQPVGKSALYNKDFLQYASNVINNYIDYMGDDGTFFNVGSKIRATARDNMHVIFLKAFTSACDSFLSASTFHNDLVSLPLYSSVNYWQYNAAEDFDYKSGIVIVPSSEEGQDNPTTQTVGNIVGVLLDRMAVGTTISEKWSASDRFNSERRTNYTMGCNIGYFNDLSENGIIITLN